MSIQGIPHPEGLVLVLTLGIFMLLGSFTSILIYSWMIQKLRISNNQIFDLFRLIGKKHAYTYALCVIFMILVSLEMSKYVLWVVVRLPQRLKSTLFETFSSLRVHPSHSARITSSLIPNRKECG